MYNPIHETKPQANYNCSSRRYMRVLETCHGLRLKEDIQSPEPTGSGLFVSSLHVVRATRQGQTVILMRQWRVAPTLNRYPSCCAR